MFSVVMPNFNHAELLPRAVRALVDQNPRPSEIIIINDGSTDHSQAVIADLMEEFSFIKLIQHDINVGVVRSMNEGLATSHCDYVYFAAADDYCLTGLFSSAEAALSTYPEAAFFCARACLMNPTGQRLGLRPFMWPTSKACFISPAMARREFAKSDNWCVGSTVIYRRQRLIGLGGFDENMQSFTDGIVVRRLALEFGFYFDVAVVAMWEVHQMTLSSRAALSVKENRRLVEAAVKGVLEKFPPDYREDYAKLLERRLRFNMARLWVIFDKHSDIRGLGQLLDLKAASGWILKLFWKLPGNEFLALICLFLMFRPYSLDSIFWGWYRSRPGREYNQMHLT